MRPRLWQPVPADDAAAARLEGALGLDPVIARLLVQRGLADPDAAHRFLHPSIEHLHDPYALTGVRAAVDRLLTAIERQELVAIHGDYDVDGITSTVMLRRALELLGGRVSHFIPERLRDGYGLQVAAIDRLHAEGVRLVVSVDCGIRSLDAGRRARELGMDLIVTDHHEPEGELPAALAVINPKRHDCGYPEKMLAGVGVTLKIVQALCLERGRQHWLPGFLKLAALGTLADVVPLTGENRVIAHLGLAGLSSPRHTAGLRALLESAELQGRRVDAYHVSFVLAPRINAAGRMSSPDVAARLLLACDEAQLPEARTLAQQLHEENRRRQEEEAAILAAARRLVDSDPDIGAHNVLVVSGQGWHRGVVGIVASKLVDAYCRPAVVIAVDGDTAHGSCRSIPGFDMLGALERCADLFERFGGHRQAAGLTMEAARVPELRRRLAAWANEVLGPDDLRPRLRIDSPLRLGAIGPAFVRDLARLAPFGMGNARPVFATYGAEVSAGPTLLKERHLCLSVAQDGRVFRAIAWRAAEHLDLVAAHRRGLDLAYTLEENTYRGESSLELRLEDLRGAPVPAAATAADAASPADARVE
ncbi:MAG: single-stranded-DNA-specific exonuclease RecJ [Vicinamibacteraceae bacterium]|nr:single-stranded-DNA-specific exonuclease RecJ [Vicinamibacteraceae bacterium]